MLSQVSGCESGFGGQGIEGALVGTARGLQGARLGFGEFG